MEAHSTTAARARDPLYFYSNRELYGEFSNFWHAPIVVGSRSYPTVEHYFQAQKTHDPAQQQAIRQARTPPETKRLGRRCTLRLDWELVKEEVMLTALRAKFTQHPALGRLLAETHPRPLHEDSPSDFYWGSRGQDRLGALLMQVRDELRAATAEGEPPDA